MFKRSGVWWTCIRHNGRKIQKSLETSDRKLAKAIEAKVRTEIVVEKYFKELVGRNKTFRDMLDRLMRDHAPTVSDSQQRSYATSSKHLLKFFGDMKLLSISSDTISEYKVLRREAGLKPATINREVAMLSKAFSMAVKKWKWIACNPASDVEREKEDNERDRWLTAEEEECLLEMSPKWLSDIILFNLQTGLRQDELLSLTWDRVDMLRKTIIINVTKNGKPKTIPLNKTALGILESKAKVITIRNKIVFHSNSGTKIDKHNLRRAFVIAMKEAGIEDFTFHSLRHTFATRLAQGGVDLYKISKLLGHKDISTTQRYAHHCPESLRDGVAILEADYNLTTVERKTAISDEGNCHKSFGG